MFYSQTLLSNKGALGVIWIAAHCHKKLNKDQVFRTNIISSVETILRDEVPTVTHRILAYLLLGVVRIYSKKVEYLADDCLDMLAKMKDISKCNKADIGLESLRSPYHSIALPARFELDAFNLEGLENHDLSRDHTARSYKEITLADSRIDDIMGFHLYNKYDEGSSSHSEVYMSTHTPVKEVLSPHSMDIDIGRSPSSSTRNMKMNLENKNKSMFCLDDRLPPMGLEDLEHERGLDGLHEMDLPINLENTHAISPSNNTRNLEMGLENPNKSIFVLDDRMEPMTFDELEIEGDLHGLLEKGIQTEGEKTNIDNNHKISPSRNSTNMKLGLENISQNVFVVDDRMEPMASDEPENASGPHGLSEKEIQTGGKQANTENIHEKESGLPDKNIDTDRKNKVTEIYHEEEDAAITRVVDSEKNGEAEIAHNPGVTSPESRVSQTKKKHHVSITVDATPQSKFQAHAGEILPEVLAVCTPAAKERKRSTQKRKCYYDGQLVVSNEIFKCWINDSSDLVCKRRKVPHTAFSLWEVQKISRLPGIFLEPLISCESLDCRHLISEKTYRPEKGCQPVSSSSVEQNQSVPTLFKEQNQTASSFREEQNETAPSLSEEHNQSAPSFLEEQNQPTSSFPGQQNQTASLLSEEQNQNATSSPKVIEVAPLLAEERGPLALSISVDLEQTVPPSSAHSVDILQPATPVDSMEKCRSLSDDETLEFGLTDEEMNSNEGNQNLNDYLSVRTRKVAEFLYRRFSHKKLKGDEVIKLSQVVKGRNKKESARLFYEILVLKTRDCIDVRQKKAYEDIQVMQTPALKKAFQVEG